MNNNQVFTSLIEQVKRNIKRLPDDFMFQLNDTAFEILMSQNATSSWGGTRKNPYAFTEHGVLMLSSVLGSDRAIDVNIKNDFSGFQCHGSYFTDLKLPFTYRRSFST